MYRLMMPHPALAPYIESYWALKIHIAAAETFSESIFVDVRADVLFNFGAPYQRELPDGGRTVLNASNVDAPRDHPVSVMQSGTIDLTGVRFHAGGLSAFARPPMGQLLNQTVSITDLFGAEAYALEGRLYEAGSSEAQKRVLDDFFLRRLYPSDKHRLVMHITRMLDGAPNLSMGSLARETCYSPRMVQRLFVNVIGIAPKFYARVARFQRALALLPYAVSLAEVALRAGYYDQPHLSRDFRALAGQSPELTRAFLLTRFEAPAPNLVRFVQDPSSGAV